MSKKHSAARLRDVVSALETIAPSRFAQSWDNVGLLTGDLNARCKSALFCIDMMPAVVDEAIATKVDLVVSYHPPLFKPINRLVTPSQRMEDGIYRCIARRIAVYSPHTALDVAVGGTNDVLAAHCGVTNAAPIERAISASRQSKLVVFVPEAEAEQLTAALSAAGAGVIGEYHHCSFRSRGVGTFQGSSDSNPTVGQRGKLEHVSELRLEMICDNKRLPQVIDALNAAHSYEEPAFDVYPLTEVASHGIGRVGQLAASTPLKKLAQRLKRRTGARCVSIVGEPTAMVERAIIGVGAAGSMPFALYPGAGDVVVTGEMRHHDALRLMRADACAVILSHWSSERPALNALASRLSEAVPSLKTHLSEADREPFERV